MSNSTTGGGGSLATPVSVANGGTGANNKTSGFDNLSPATTKGDIISHDGTNNIRLAVGTNTQVLIADSTETAGVKWGSAGAGDVVGPASAVDNRICTFDTTTGKLIQDSGTLVADLLLASNNLSDVAVAGTARTNLGLAIGTDVQAYDAGLADIAGLAVTDSNIIVGDGANWVAETGATARTSLGLGSISTQASNSVSITGGSVTGITDIVVADGGTGASTLTGVLTGNGTGAVTAAAVTQYGVLVGGASNAVASTAVGSASEVLTSNGAGLAPTFQAAAGGAFTPAIFCKNYYWMWADFISANNSPNEFGRYSNGGSGGFLSSELNHPGVYQITTSSSATGRSNMYNGQKGFLLGAGETTVEWCINLKTALSTGTETYTFFCGLMDDSFTQSVTSANDLCGFRYTHTENSGNWTGVGKEDGSETTADLGTAAAVDTWVRLKIIVNAAGTSASYYINDSEGTNSPITTNIPNTADQMIFVAGIVKSAGTTNRAVYLDYCEALIALTSSRND